MSKRGLHQWSISSVSMTAEDSAHTSCFSWHFFSFRALCVARLRSRRRVCTLHISFAPSFSMLWNLLWVIDFLLVFGVVRKREAPVTARSPDQRNETKRRKIGRKSRRGVRVWISIKLIVKWDICRTSRCGEGRFNVCAMTFGISPNMRIDLIYNFETRERNRTKSLAQIWKTILQNAIHDQVIRNE